LDLLETLRNQGEYDALSSPNLPKIASLDSPGRMPILTQPTKVAGTHRRAVRSWKFAGILGGWHMECAYCLSSFVKFRLLPFGFQNAVNSGINPPPNEKLVDWQ
jgi:hypothetical protein